MSGLRERQDASGDPLARLGERLIGAERVRRRRRRHARQRLAGGLATVAALIALVAVAAPFEGGDRPPVAGERVELREPGGRFVVYGGGLAPGLCSDRPNGRDRAGTTTCLTQPLVAGELERYGTALVSARAVGDQIVLSGVAEPDATRIGLFPRSRRGGSDGVRERLDGEPLTIVGAAEQELTVRPFVVTAPRESDDVRWAFVDVERADGEFVGRTLTVGALPADEVNGSRLTFAVDGGSGAAAIAELAQARLQFAGPGLNAVSGDGDRLIVQLPTSAPQPRAAARAALEPGRLTVYDWEASALLPDGRTVADGLGRGVARATTLSRGSGPSVGMRLEDAQALAGAIGQLPQRLGGPPARTSVAVVQTFEGGARATLPRDDPRARFHLLRGRPALGSDALMSTNSGGQRDRQPIMRLALRGESVRALSALTGRAVARGQALAQPGTPPQASVQHLALVLDGRLLALLPLDARHVRQLDAGLVEITGHGLTKPSASMLAAKLILGPLPPLRELR